MFSSFTIIFFFFAFILVFIIHISHRFKYLIHYRKALYHIIIMHNIYQLIFKNEMLAFLGFVFINHIFYIIMFIN